MIFITYKKTCDLLVSDKKCAICNKSVKTGYFAMKEWVIDGIICGKCYSQKIAEFYPGDHVRTNLSKE